MNRYTQLTPASFNPLSVEEIMMVPLAKQARHDQTQLAAMQEGIFDNPYLDTDSGIVEQEMSGIKQGLADIEEELATKGVSNGITRKMLALKRKKIEFLSPAGIGGKAASNYAGYQQNVKDIMANDATPQEKMMQIQAAKRQYEATGGVAEGANYNPYLGFNTYDIPKFLMDVGANINPEVIERESGWKRTADGTMWTNGTTKTTKLPREVIQSVMMKAAAGNPELVSYLQEKSRVTPGFDAASELMKAVMGASDQFIQNEYSRKTDMKFPPEWMANSIGDGNPAFRVNTITPDKNPKKGTAFDTDILRGTISPDLGGMEKLTTSHSGLGAYNQASNQSPYKGPTRPKNYNIANHASKNQIKIWKEYGEQQIPGFNINNPNHQAQLADILDDKSQYGTGQVTYNTIDPTIENFGNLLEGQKQTAINATVNAAQKRKVDAVYQDPQNPGTIITYNDLLEQYGTTNTDGTSDVEIMSVEAVSAANPFSYLLKKGWESYTSEFHAPVQIQLKTPQGIKKMVMSRSLGDLTQKGGVRYANKEINETLSRAKSISGFKQKANLYDTELGVDFDAVISYHPEIHPDAYIVEQKGEEPYIADEASLMESIYKKWENGKTKN